MSIQEIINQIIEEEGKLQARIDSSPTSVSPNYRFSIYYQNLGDALLKLKRNHEAFQAYSRAAELQENYNKDGAIACYQKLISLNSNYIAAYEKLTQLQSSNWKNWLILSQKLEQKGETEKAIASYQEVIKLNTDYIEVYEKLTHLQPNNWKHWFVLGDKLAERGETERAINCYQKVIKLNAEYILAYEKLTQLQPSNWGNWLVLGDKLAGRGETERAINCYQEVIRLNPEHILTHTKLAQLQPNSSVLSNFQLGKNFLLEGNRGEAMRTWHHANQLRFAEVKSKGVVGSILLCSLPKSGTVYINNSLAKGLGLLSGKLSPLRQWIEFYWSDELGFNIEIKSPAEEIFNRPILSSLDTVHMIPNQWNLFAISLMFDRLVVNVRDPRQSLISWIEHIKRFSANNNTQIEMYRIWTVNEFFQSESLKNEIDFQLENENGYFFKAIKWIEGWLDASKDPDFYPEILLTKFEDLATNPKAFFEKVLDFYEIEKSSFTFPEPPQFKEGTHYRKGRTDEWREVFTPEQKEKATKMIPQRLLDKFGWPTE
ncbi:tetratricopeptide repeat protein [Microcoleus sp. A006_D1]|uniref:tetratricopeptide repeat protein n=1 Tax=Microcoleus sp. A006_D1 TaxID=3055267 RepID=UPI002FCE804A